MTVFLLYSEAQQRKSKGLEGKEEGEKGEEEEREEREMVRLCRKCRNINIGTRMAGTMFIFHVCKLYILLPVVQSWSACSIQLSTLSMLNTSRCFSPSSLGLHQFIYMRDVCFILELFFLCLIFK